jgi:hypothetical protein
MSVPRPREPPTPLNPEPASQRLNIPSPGANPNRQLLRFFITPTVHAIGLFAMLHFAWGIATDQRSPAARAARCSCSGVLKYARRVRVCGGLQEAKELLARVGELDRQALGDALTHYGIKAPETGNDISDPFPFNLMFKTSIGPKGDVTGYLRPETAQGIFVNFK